MLPGTQSSPLPLALQVFGLQELADAILLYLDPHHIRIVRSTSRSLHQACIPWFRIELVGSGGPFACSSSFSSSLKAFGHLVTSFERDRHEKNEIWIDVTRYCPAIEALVYDYCFSPMKVLLENLTRLRKLKRLTLNFEKDYTVMNIYGLMHGLMGSIQEPERLLEFCLWHNDANLEWKSTLEPFLDRFENLRRLELRTIPGLVVSPEEEEKGGGTEEGQMRQRVVKVYPSMVAFVLTGSKIAPAAAWMIRQCFPNLKEIEIYNMEDLWLPMVGQRKRDTSLRPPFPELRRLHVSFLSLRQKVEEYLEKLPEGSFPQELRDLRVTYFMGDDIALGQRLCRENVRLKSLWMDTETPTRLHFLALECCRDLTVLKTTGGVSLLPTLAKMQQEQSEKQERQQSSVSTLLPSSLTNPLVLHSFPTVILPSFQPLQSMQHLTVLYLMGRDSIPVDSLDESRMNQMLKTLVYLVDFTCERPLNGFNLFKGLGRDALEPQASTRTSTERFLLPLHERPFLERLQIILVLENPTDEDTVVIKSRLRHQFRFLTPKGVRFAFSRPHTR